MKTKEIIEILQDLSERLRVKGENEFKARAYENAADIIVVQDIDVKTRVAEGTLREVDGFGDALTEKLTDLIENGKMQYYEKIKEEIPDSLMEILNIDGLGHKKVHQLHEELNVNSIDDLLSAAENGKIANLKGFSDKSEKSILEKIKEYKSKNTQSDGTHFKHIK